MQQILENELLGYCFLPLGEDAGALADSLTDDDAEALRTALAELLIDQAAEDGLIETGAVEVPAVQDFKSILYRDSGKGGTRKVVAFSFRDAAVETALPLIGIAITVFTHKLALATLPQIGGVLKTLWSKVVVLKRPADSDAIDALEAVVRIRARQVAKGGEDYPTTAEVERHLDRQTETVRRALTRLKSSAVLEVVSWGGQTEDVGHPGTSWKVRL
ncbi:MAG TPA: hypothetical protein VH394_20735 [Thermoanaerobaculia bacterium]|jgi:hypothetical protein|nr:hypothetical protein [Thermoanaerobaculia bacterium]